MYRKIKKLIIISLVISNITFFSCGKKEGMEIIRLNNTLKENVYSSKSIKEYKKYLGKSSWFLRDSLIFDLTEDLVKKDYIIDYVNYCGQFQKFMNSTSFGFRPAIWVSLKQ